MRFWTIHCIEFFTGAREATLCSIKLRDVEFVWMQCEETGAWEVGVLLDYVNLKFDPTPYNRS